jgi:hypothetical protein
LALGSPALQGWDLDERMAKCFQGFSPFGGALAPMPFNEE